MSEKANIEHDGIGESGGKLINDIQDLYAELFKVNEDLRKYMEVLL